MSGPGTTRDRSAAAVSVRDDQRGRRPAWLPIAAIVAALLLAALFASQVLGGDEDDGGTGRDAPAAETDQGLDTEPPTAEVDDVSQP